MEKFYDPRKGQNNTPVQSGYDPSVDSGSSGGEVNDLHPERAYGTDTRRLGGEEKLIAGKADTQNIKDQDRVHHFMAAARVAGRYKQNALIDEPGLRGETPRTEANIKGTNVPTLGDRIGIGGSANYARKPKKMAGKFTGF
jgi:hypothetical protein